MSVVLPEMISRQLYVYGLFDELVAGMALRAGRQGDVVPRCRRTLWLFHAPVLPSCRRVRSYRQSRAHSVNLCRAAEEYRAPEQCDQTEGGRRPS